MLEQQIDSFIKECHIKGLSHNTIKRYERVLHNFNEFLYEYAGERDIKDITINDLEPFLVKEYIFKLQKKGISNSSVKNEYDIIKLFIRHIVENYDINFDFSKLKINIKNPHKIKPHLTKNEYEKVLNALKEKLRKTKSLNVFSTFLTIYILALTGMRAEELIKMKKNNISIDDEWFLKLKIKGKGGKERENFILLENIEEFLEKYERLKKKENIFENEYFIVNKKNKPLKYNNLYVTNNKFLLKLGIDKNKKGLHLYRRTFGMLKLQEGHDIAAISEWLGHHNIGVTHKYYARANEIGKKRLILKN
ncbi:tyrosine-type recombinase/integrase [Caminibacter pacificus]|uniref:Integrase/recombinase XerD n=1 Tax=Caminibacter pacificus TaxID=1424653 RepID=A0AAJ4RB12_9BACT|nr:site-specific integrase [Caminibacter pacificus]QDD68217.1 hypothetical protein C6V80_10200 [Caminibacter pacificus]ROR38731.1 integrase/recombinase XerD [Caminibacter pacificus]